MTATILPEDIGSRNILPAAADNRGTTGFGIIIRPLTPHDACLRVTFVIKTSPNWFPARH